MSGVAGRLRAVRGSNRMPSRGTALLGLGILGLFLVSWSPQALTPILGVPSIDPSWQSALHMAAFNDSIHWGSGFIYTYGPLGFLKLPVLWGTKTGLLAWLYTVVTRLALTAILFLSVRRWLGWIGAAAVVLLILPLGVQTMPIAAFGAAVWALTRAEPPPWPFAAAAGAVSAVELLAKTGTGVTVSAVLVVALAFGSRGRLRGLAIFAGALVATGLVAWTVLGQSWGDLPDFVVNTMSIVGGYSSSIDVDGQLWQYTLALGIALGGLVAMFRLQPLASSRTRTGLLLVWLVYAFLVFKEGFVRHDPLHAMEFFVGMGGAVALLPFTRRERGVGAVGILAALGIVFSVGNLQINSVVRPVTHVRAFKRELTTMASGAKRERVYRQGRAAVVAGEQIDPRLIALIGRRTVHVLPDDAVAAWGYGLNWRPLPVPQGFSAYTTRLDDLDASAVRSDSRAPAVMLVKQFGSLDGRHPGFDEPETMVQILCRYRTTRAIGAWAVITRGPSRCGGERLVARVHSGFGHEIAVPRLDTSRDAFLIAKVDGVQVTGIEKLRNMLYKARDRAISLDDGPPAKLIPGTAGDGLPLRAAKGYDLPGALAFVPHPRRILITRAGNGHGSLTVSFYAVERAPR